MNFTGQTSFDAGIQRTGAQIPPAPHFTFGSGDRSFADASEGFKGWGADEVAPPRS